MRNDGSDRFQIRVRGPLACFTRPEMKVERFSYDVMTPSAARGVLQAILWKPQMAWRVHAIQVLAPIRRSAFSRNEVQARAHAGAAAIFIEDERTQRNTVALRDVDYVLEASLALTNLASGADSVGKYVDMFLRRVRKGQYHHAPYLGCREFPAFVGIFEGDAMPIDRDVVRPLGLMFYDFDWPDVADTSRDHGVVRPLFFEARLAHGVLHVPSLAEVRRSIGEGAP